MHLVTLATATDDAAYTEYQESERFASLTASLEEIGVSLQSAWNLLGKHDYLMVFEIGDDPSTAFRAMSLIAQSGTMRTESMMAMPLADYFRMAADLGPDDLG